MVTALQKHTEPVQKITIVPRTMGALGYTLQTPEEEKFLQTKDELLAKIRTYMAGRAAEELVFDSITSGAANDIEMATRIARAMVTQYGMSEEFGMMSLESVENRYLDGRPVLNCGEETAAKIDNVVQKIIKDAHAEAMKLLEENREILDRISNYLYEHETITGKEFMKMFCEMKGLPLPDEKKEEGKTKAVGAAEKTETVEVVQIKEDSAEKPALEHVPQDRTAEQAQTSQTEKPVAQAEPTMQEKPAEQAEAETQEKSAVQEELHAQDTPVKVSDEATEASKTQPADTAATEPKQSETINDEEARLDALTRLLNLAESKSDHSKNKED